MKCLQLLKILLQSKDEELCNQFLDIFPALLQFLFHFRNRQQNLIYSQVLEIVRIIYSDFPKLQPPLVRKTAIIRKKPCLNLKGMLSTRQSQTFSKA